MQNQSSRPPPPPPPPPPRHTKLRISKNIFCIQKTNIQCTMTTHLSVLRSWSQFFFLSTAISQESKAHKKKLSFSSTSFNKYLTLIGKSKRVLFWISLFFNKTSQGSFSKEILWERDWIFPQNTRFLLSELLLSIQV